MHRQIRIGLPKLRGRIRIGLPKVYGRFCIGPPQVFHPICPPLISTVGEFRCTIAKMQEKRQNVKTYKSVYNVNVNFVLGRVYI